ncbi:hypothetical protein ACW95P_01960 [Candidatus Mycoplasma pogonae]
MNKKLYKLTALGVFAATPVALIACSTSDASENTVSTTPLVSKSNVEFIPESNLVKVKVSGLQAYATKKVWVFYKTGANTTEYMGSDLATIKSDGSAVLYLDKLQPNSTYDVKVELYESAESSMPLSGAPYIASGAFSTKNIDNSNSEENNTPVEPVVPTTPSVLSVYANVVEPTKVNVIALNLDAYVGRKVAVEYKVKNSLRKYVSLKKLESTAAELEFKDLQEYKTLTNAKLIVSYRETTNEANKEIKDWTSTGATSLTWKTVELGLNDTVDASTNTPIPAPTSLKLTGLTASKRYDLKLTVEHTETVNGKVETKTIPLENGNYLEAFFETLATGKEAQTTFTNDFWDPKMSALVEVTEANKSKIVFALENLLRQTEYSFELVVAEEETVVVAPPTTEAPEASATATNTASSTTLSEGTTETTTTDSSPNPTPTPTTTTKIKKVETISTSSFNTGNLPTVSVVRLNNGATFNFTNLPASFFGKEVVLKAVPMDSSSTSASVSSSAPVLVNKVNVDDKGSFSASFNDVDTTSANLKYHLSLFDATTGEILSLDGISIPELLDANKTKEVTWTSLSNSSFELKEETTAAVKVGALGAAVELSNLKIYQGFKVKIKYGRLITKHTPEEILKQENKHAETDAKEVTENAMTFNLLPLVPGADYVYAVYLVNNKGEEFLIRTKTASEAEFKNNRKFKTNNVLRYKVYPASASEPETNYKISGNSVKVTITGDQASFGTAYSDKKLLVIAVPSNGKTVYAANFFPEDSKAKAKVAKSALVSITSSDTEKEFIVSGLESSTQYTYQVFVEDEQAPLLLPGNNVFTSGVVPAHNLSFGDKNKAKLKLTQLSSFSGMKLKVQKAQKPTDDTPASFTDVSSSSSSYTVSQDNVQNGLEVEIDSLTENKFDWLYKVSYEEPATSGTWIDLISPTPFTLPKAKAEKATVGGVTVKVTGGQLILGQTLKLQYRKKDDTTGSYTDFTTNALVDVNGEAEFVIPAHTLNADTEYLYKVMLVEGGGTSATAKELLNVQDSTLTFKTLSKPIVTISDITSSSIKVSIVSLYDIAGRSVKIKYRKNTTSDTDSTVVSGEWTETTAQDVLGSPEASSKVEFEISGLEANSTYEFQAVLDNNENMNAQAIEATTKTTTSTTNS